MSELKVLLDSVIVSELTCEELDYFNNCDDNSKEVFMNNKRYFYDKKLRQDALKKVLTRRYESYMLKLIESNEADELLPTLKKIREEEDKKDESVNSDNCFITISPGEVLSYLEFIRLIEKFVKLKPIKSYCYVLEQRYSGIPDEKYKKLGEGLHTHIFIKKSEYKPSHIRRDLKRIFANVVVNIDVSFRHDRDIEKTFNYIIGEKKDDSKKIKQEQDRIYREMYGIKSYYGTLWNQ